MNTFKALSRRLMKNFEEQKNAPRTDVSNNMPRAKFQVAMTTLLLFNTTKVHIVNLCVVNARYFARMKLKLSSFKEPKHDGVVVCVSWNNTEDVFSCG